MLLTFHSNGNPPGHANASAWFPQIFAAASDYSVSIVGGATVVTAQAVMEAYIEARQVMPAGGEISLTLGDVSKTAGSAGSYKPGRHSEDKEAKCQVLRDASWIPNVPVSFRRVCAGAAQVTRIYRLTCRR